MGKTALVPKLRAYSPAGADRLNNKYTIENCSKGCEGKEEVAERDRKGDGVLRRARGEFSQDAFNCKKS